VKADSFPAGDSQATISGVTIVLPSITITRTESGYDFRRHGDQTFQHIVRCTDLWEAIDNIQHHVCLTPTILTELNFLRKKCAELRWDDRAVASYYEALGREKEAAARATEKEKGINYLKP